MLTLSTIVKHIVPNVLRSSDIPAKHDLILKSGMEKIAKVLLRYVNIFRIISIYDIFRYNHPFLPTETNFLKIVLHIVVPCAKCYVLQEEI